jgi:hypothetical protein
LLEAGKTSRKHEKAGQNHDFSPLNSFLSNLLPSDGNKTLHTSNVHVENYVQTVGMGRSPLWVSLGALAASKPPKFSPESWISVQVTLLDFSQSIF